MRLDTLSTFTFLRTTRQPIARATAELGRAQTEVSTGRVADLGLAHGAVSGEVVGLNVQRARLEALQDANGFVAARLTASASALEQVAGATGTMMGTLLLVRRGETGASVVAQQAGRDLDAVIGSLNASVNGEYLFAGIDTDVEPIDDFAAGSPARAAVDASFFAAFGFAQDDPAAATISGPAMAAWLDGAFADLFDDPGWGATWSAASSTVIEARISLTERVPVSVSAENPAVRETLKAFAMLAASGLENLRGEARDAVIDRSIAVVGAAAEGLTRLRTGLGAAEARVADANARLAIQIDAVGKLELDATAADPYLAAARVNELSVRLEASYAVTRRIYDLSLLNYLR